MKNASIVPLFATPFAVLSVPDADQLNPIVANILRERAAADTDPSPASNPYCYRSRSCVEFNDPSVQRISGEILRGMTEVVAALNTLGEEPMRALAVQTCLSFTIVRPNGSVPAHNLPLTSWCGIYCVEAPELSADRRDSGVLRLYESRLRHMFSDATNSVMPAPYASGHYAWRPMPGQLAVFPGSTSHGIALIRASGSLLLLTLRLRFVAPGQTGWTTW